jgi:hypothetical protein
LVYQFAKKGKGAKRESSLNRKVSLFFIAKYEKSKKRELGSDFEIGQTILNIIFGLAPSSFYHGWSSILFFSGE